MEVRTVKALKDKTGLKEVVELNTDARYIFKFPHPIPSVHAEIMRAEVEKFGIKALFLFGDFEVLELISRSDEAESTLKAIRNDHDRARSPIYQRPRA